MKKAVVLLSGGIDSSTCAAIARHEGYAVYAMSFAYGQRHAIELESARRVASFLEVTAHHVVTIDLRAFGGSSLTSSSIEVPRDRHVDEMDHAIPSTYVPARNTIFLSFALGWAEVLDCSDIFIGVNAVDYSGYPDCRPEFIEAFGRMANLATKAGVEGNHITIRTPLINLTKAQIIHQGTSLGLDYGITHSCYDPSPSGLACGTCDSCIIRKRGFLEAGLEDPTRYR
jgi:7-cyano-7-deazaguanine synthase